MRDFQKYVTSSRTILTILRPECLYRAFVIHFMFVAATKKNVMNTKYNLSPV